MMEGTVEHPNKQFVRVRWDDAWSSDAEVEAEDIDHSPAPVVSYGWLLRSDEIGVTVAAEWGIEDKKYRAVTFVPRGMVREETPLKFAKKRARKSTPLLTSSTSSTPSD